MHPAAPLIVRDRQAVAGEAAGAVPLVRCRELLGRAAAEWTDAEVLSLRERLAYLAELAVDLAAEAERKAA